MTSREDLLKLFKEICIRFDTDPKRYSKFDFGALLKYLNGDKEWQDYVITLLNIIAPNLNDAYDILNVLKSRIDTNDSQLAALELSDLNTASSITNINTNISNILNTLSDINNVLNPLSITLSYDSTLHATDDIKSQNIVIKVYRGNINITEQTVIKIDGIQTSSNISLTPTPSKYMYTITASYNGQEASSKIIFNFSKRCYWGGINKLQLDTFDITNLSSKPVKFNEKVMMTTSNYEYAGFAYAKEFGLLSEILDLNGFVCTSDFLIKEITVNSIPYYLYYRIQVGYLNQPFTFKL